VRWFRFKLNPLWRISAALVLLTLMLLVMADLFFAILPDEQAAARTLRQQVSQNLAAQLVTLLQGKDYALAARTMRSVVLNDPQMLSIAARKTDGFVVAQAGDHARYWQASPDGRSTLTHFQIPVNSDGGRWGTLEFSFRSLPSQRPGGWLLQPLPLLMLILGLGGMGLYYLFLRRILQHLDPSSVIPDRVKRAFDSLTEGLLVLDSQGRIVLVNAAFFALLPKTIRAFTLGEKLSALEWLKPAESIGAEAQPWAITLQYGKAFTGMPMDIEVAGEESRKTLLNCSPVLDDGGRIRGCLVTFDDVTEQYRLNAQLSTAMKQLTLSSQIVEQKNVELSQMAMQDPLTGAYNRRALLDRFGPMFEQAIKRDLDLCCIIADIDLFKRFNDTYGHTLGDQVIIAVARELANGLRPTDVVARYGGEEYCVLLPGLTVTQALEVAERIREKIETRCGGMIEVVADLKITASFGLASIRQGAENYQDLIEQADYALYAAKQAGRNRVVIYTAASGQMNAG
jgi:diguanylate cyclase (GGDEF)-like protein